MTYCILTEETLEDMTMSELKAHAKSIGTRAPEGTGHRRGGWVKAIGRKQSKLVALEDQLSLSDNGDIELNIEVSTDEMIAAGLLEAPTIGSIKEATAEQFEGYRQQAAANLLASMGASIIPCDDEDFAFEVIHNNRFVTFITFSFGFFKNADWRCDGRYHCSELAAVDYFERCEPAIYRNAIASLN
jgi:hypothetical protein